MPWHNPGHQGSLHAFGTIIRDWQKGGKKEKSEEEIATFDFDIFQYKSFYSSSQWDLSRLNSVTLTFQKLKQTSLPATHNWSQFKAKASWSGFPLGQLRQIQIFLLYPCCCRTGNKLSAQLSHYNVFPHLASSRSRCWWEVQRSQPAHVPTDILLMQNIKIYNKNIYAKVEEWAVSSQQIILFSVG